MRTAEQAHQTDKDSARLAATLAASQVIAHYYLWLGKYMTKNSADCAGLLTPLAHLMTGTENFCSQSVAYMCADQAVRVFAPLSLDAEGADHHAQMLRKLSEIDSYQAGADAYCAAYNVYAGRSQVVYAAYAASFAADSILDDDITGLTTAWWAALTACHMGRATEDWQPAIKLYRDLCELPES